MRVLITGASGFIGSNLLTALSESNEVGVIIRPRSKLDCTTEKFVYDGSLDSILKTFDSFKPDAVIHLASYYVYDHKQEEVDRLIESNLKIGIYLLEAMRQNRVKYLINTGTSFEHFGEEESEVVNLYAATKQAFGNLCKYYCDAGHLKAVSIKLFDTYGEGDPRKKLLSLLKENLKTKDELLLSPGDQIIDIVHVRDVVRAFQIVLEQMENYSESYVEFGLSNNQRCTLKELVSLIEKIAGEKVNIKWGARPYRDREVMKPWSSFTAPPNWEPNISLEDGIKRYFAS